MSVQYISRWIHVFAGIVFQAIRLNLRKENSLISNSRQPLKELNHESLSKNLSWKCNWLIDDYDVIMIIITSQGVNEDTRKGKLSTYTT